jgi:hypothetical protein
MHEKIGISVSIGGGGEAEKQECECGECYECGQQDFRDAVVSLVSMEPIKDGDAKTVQRAILKLIEKLPIESKSEDEDEDENEDESSGKGGSDDSGSEYA